MVSIPALVSWFGGVGAGGGNGRPLKFELLPKKKVRGLLRSATGGQDMRNPRRAKVQKSAEKRPIAYTRWYDTHAKKQAAQEALRLVARTRKTPPASSTRRASRKTPQAVPSTCQETS